MIRTKKDVEFNDFVRIYGEKYKPEHLEIIKLAYNIRRNKSMSDNYALINEVFSYLDIIKPDKNYYIAFLEYLKEYYDINRNLLEVGSGHFPELARRIHLEQKSGSITCYDPDSIIDLFREIIIYQKRFDFSIDVTKYDMLYGFDPCEATKVLIEKANRADKDLVLKFCGCKLQGERFGVKNELNYDENNPVVSDYNTDLFSIIEGTMPAGRDYEIDFPDFAPYGILRTFKKR